jgi:hypothetical protein
MGSAGLAKAQSQGTAIATVTGGPVVSVQSLSSSVSKGQGLLTTPGTVVGGTITFTMILAHLTGP